MAILKNVLLSLLLLSLSGCLVNSDGTITLISPVEADTFISSTDLSDHSNLEYLSLSRSGADENRVLVKLPTGNNDYNSHLDGCLSNPFCFFFFMPITIVAAIIAPNCDDSSFTAANLNWAYLEFTTEDNSSPAAGTIDIQLVGEPWWHTVSWPRTHPFS
ncbi:MAG: hypothetical protein MJK18_08530, partial [Bdellovibrionales bacterium]|nr:hypothetical protein [Bdellovibrionales bacterium]